MTPAILLLLALIPLAPAQETTKLEQIRTRGKLIVSVKNQGPPAAGAHKDPAHFQKRGFEIELAERIAQKVFAGRKPASRPSARVDLRILPKAKRLPAVMAGDVDLVISMIAVTDERKAQVDFSSPYYVGGLAVMTRSDSASTSAKIADLAGKRVGWALQNANNPERQIEDAWKARGIKVELVRFPTFKLAADALRSKKVDAMVSWNPNIAAFLDTAPKDFRRMEELLTIEHYAVAVRKGDGDLLRLVNGVVEAMRSGGELAQLAAKHGLAFPKDED